jgi:hypothetical protein
VNLAAVDAERDIVDRHDAAEALFEVLEADHFHGASSGGWGVVPGPPRGGPGINAIG